LVVQAKQMVGEIGVKSCVRAICSHQGVENEALGIMRVFSVSGIQARVLESTVDFECKMS
jgi:hypothetical protein